MNINNPQLFDHMTTDDGSNIKCVIVSLGTVTILAGSHTKIVNGPAGLPIGVKIVSLNATCNTGSPPGNVFPVQGQASQNGSFFGTLAVTWDQNANQFTFDWVTTAGSNLAGNLILTDVRVMIWHL